MGETKRIMCSTKARKRVSAMRSANYRPAVKIVQHRRAVTANEGMERAMDSYRYQIIKMLDHITDADVMRLIHDIIKAKLEKK